MQYSDFLLSIHDVCRFIPVECITPMDTIVLCADAIARGNVAYASPGSLSSSLTSFLFCLTRCNMAGFRHCLSLATALRGSVCLNLAGFNVFM